MSKELSREDWPLHLKAYARCADAIGAGKNYSKDLCDELTRRRVVLEEHDAAQRDRIAELDREVARLKEDYSTLRDDLNRAHEAEHQRDRDEVKRLTEERDAVLNRCHFAFGDLLCCAGRGHTGRHHDRPDISAVAWTTEESTTRELAALRAELEHRK